MRSFAGICLLALCFSPLSHSSSDGAASRVRQVAERITLDQLGTKPFHLKAGITSSRGEDADRTGEVEIWWASPTHYRREVRSQNFRQTEIVDGDKVWQKSDGEYFPEWLRETAVALVRPFPYLQQTLDNVKDADVKRLVGSTYYQWTEYSTDGNVKSGMEASVALNDSTGLLFYAGGLGWDGLYKDYQKFHDRMIARTVTHGSPEVTAKIVTLEDFNPAANTSLLDASAAGSAQHPIHTLVIDEASLRKHLVAGPPPTWPALQDGPFEGSATTIVSIDRTGAVREVDNIISNNQAINEAAKKNIDAMKFSPYEADGQPVQVVSRVTLPFKLVRPAGAENFDSAKGYFERGRRAGFLAAAAKAPYALRAEFDAKASSGQVEKGRYEDTWYSDTEWKREAHIGNSTYIRSRYGDKRYQFAEGPDTAMLKFVLRAMEPIPAIDTYYEGDWHIQRESLYSVSTVRVLTGYVAPSGNMDPNVRAYWFDDKGDLVRAHFNGLDVLRFDFADYSGVDVAHRVEVMKGTAVGIRIQVLEIAPPKENSSDFYQLPNHEWTRAFTDEVR